MKYAALYISAVIFVMFGLQIVFGTAPFALIVQGMFDRPHTIITSIFAHGGLEHLLSNLFSLILFGLILEGRVGFNRVIYTFLGAGILANLLMPLTPYGSVVGASGAIFGIIGALVVLRPFFTIWMGFMPMPMVVAALVWIIQDLFGVFYPSTTANLAHLFGLGIGALIGVYFRSEGFGDQLNRSKKRHDDIDAHLDRYEREVGLR